MRKIKAFAAHDAESILGTWNLERRMPGDRAYDRMLKADVKYRFVVDMASL